MRLSAHDDYGIRLLLRIARGEEGTCMTTAVLAEREGMSMSHVGKVLRLLKAGGFVESTRGNCGGYKLTRAPEEIVVGEVLAALGGRLFDDAYCEGHAPGQRLCTGTVECATRSLWQVVQYNLDQVLGRLTVRDLLGAEGERKLSLASQVSAPGAAAPLPSSGASPYPGPARVVQGIE